MKGELRTRLADALSRKTGLGSEEILRLLEEPKRREFGDVAFPCFILAKKEKLPLPQCAERLARELALPEGIVTAEAVGPFVNFRFDRRLVLERIVRSVLAQPERIGSADHSRETVIVEYSSPNIAKPFHVGHLRTTLIGNSLDRVYRHLGYKTISINHLGDWGTQFGFVWAGCELWGKPEVPTVQNFVELYRRATQLKAEQENGTAGPEHRELPDINEMARRYFVDLEAGAEYAVRFWQWCLDVSLAYLRETYERLEIDFDHYTGESFYSDKMESIRNELEERGLLRSSEGAIGVDLGEELGFARILTPDGRTLYLTRDLATADYRARTFNFDRAVYVVGAPQTLHFQQLQAVLRLMGKEYADRMIHVPFGHVLGMKTRGEGEVVELNDFLDEAYERSLLAYREQVGKRPEGLDETAVARAVSLAAIIFSNLSRSRMKEVHFSWDHALEFQGDSGPYLLYACARINGIKEKAGGAGYEPCFDPALLTEESAYLLALRMADFETVLEQTVEENEPAHLAAFALDLAKDFSKAYLELKVLGEEKARAESRLALFEAVRIVLKTSLRLLGIPPLERM